MYMLSNALQFNMFNKISTKKHRKKVNNNNNNNISMKSEERKKRRKITLQYIFNHLSNKNIV